MRSQSALYVCELAASPVFAAGAADTKWAQVHRSEAQRNSSSNMKDPRAGSRRLAVGNQQSQPSSPWGRADVKLPGEQRALKNLECVVSISQDGPKPGVRAACFPKKGFRS